MERVYCADGLAGDRVDLTGPEAHHLARVRRIGHGQCVELFDGQGGVARGRVEQVDRHKVTVALEATIPPRPDPGIRITLATAVPKGDRFDWLIEKATELGVARIIPLRTERSVVDPRATKLDRLRRLVIEACKQSGRDRLLALEQPRNWPELLATVPEGQGLVAHPGGIGLDRIGRLHEATLAVGPEGGLTDPEVELAQQHGWRTVQLGPNILRIETACIAASAGLLAVNPAE